MNRILILAATIAALTTAACDLTPPPPPPPKAPPTTNVFIAGDSLTVQTAITNNALPQGWDVVSGLGWQAEHIQPTLATRTTDPARSPGRTVIALGQNDTATGYGTTDQLQVAQLALTPHPDACVTWVLPHYSGTVTQHLVAIDRYRAWVIDWAASHGDPVVDWRPVALADPTLIDTDGVHLTPAGRLAYGAMIQQAAAACPT